MGSDRDDFDLEFGPTNVAIQAVATSIELGDAGVALDIRGRSMPPACRRSNEHGT